MYLSTSFLIKSDTKVLSQLFDKSVQLFMSSWWYVFYHFMLVDENKEFRFAAAFSILHSFFPLARSHSFAHFTSFLSSCVELEKREKAKADILKSTH